MGLAQCVELAQGRFGAFAGEEVLASKSLQEVFSATLRILQNEVPVFDYVRPEEQQQRVIRTHVPELLSRLLQHAAPASLKPGSELQVVEAQVHAAAAQGAAFPHSKDAVVLPPVHRVIDVQHGHLAVVLQEVAPRELERLLVCGNNQAAQAELQRVSLLICVGLVHEVLKLETRRPEPVLEALEPLERGQPLAGVRLATQPLLLGLFVLPRARLHELRRLARPQLSLVLEEVARRQELLHLSPEGKGI